LISRLLAFQDQFCSSPTLEFRSYISTRFISALSLSF
jgi:hypothetical protein